MKATKIAIILICMCFSASFAAEKPKAEIRNIRITSPRLTVSRARANSNAIVTGQFGIEMSFAKPTVKTPVVRLTALCEVDGILTVHSIFLDRPLKNKGMNRSDILKAFKDNAIEIPSKERESAYQDPARFTPLLPEIAKDAYSKTLYGTGETNKGFFRLGRAKTMPKILLWRIEIWQNGVMAKSWESSSNGLGSYNLPSDWHAWKKHPTKCRYAAAH